LENEEKWYGVFQGYRPDGVGLEELFAGVPDGAEYVERLRRVYRAAYHDAWAQDAYFVVRTPLPAPDEEVAALGQELLAGLRLIAILAPLSGRHELHAYLSKVNDAAIVDLANLNRKHEDHLLVHESVADILHGFYDYRHRIIQLREGYYSVACDYWLAWYLQWPFFRQWIPRDVFSPYFHLWERGYQCAFQGESLYLARDREAGRQSPPPREMRLVEPQS
jgi:hypothetical protein